MNHFAGIGRLTNAAELSYTAKGVACVKFSICINKIWKDKDGNKKEKPNFFKCIIWGRYGELMLNYLTKGKQIAIEAELEQDSWQDGKGDNHHTVQLNVNEIFLLASPRGEKEPGTTENAPPPKANAPEVDNVPF
jgi:single-strand DNA-binding protein